MIRNAFASTKGPTVSYCCPLRARETVGRASRAPISLLLDFRKSDTGQQSRDHTTRRIETKRGLAVAAASTVRCGDNPAKSNRHTEQRAFTMTAGAKSTRSSIVDRPVSRNYHPSPPFGDMMSYLLDRECFCDLASCFTSCRNGWNGYDFR